MFHKRTVLNYRHDKVDIRMQHHNMVRSMCNFFHSADNEVSFLPRVWYAHYMLVQHLDTLC